MREYMVRTEEAAVVRQGTAVEEQAAPTGERGATAGEEADEVASVALAGKAVVEGA